ncbi:acyltransferase [Hyphomicrobium sp. LHD-15]|uniref:acyltransferase family protein n=1 Tax=Hyphomicrobium sp. LHD-15 TaxID=3072142 RepID=UPI00280C6647|nr:acyltransferase [Hyphomicrobium sp. LHD-15]MDQ8700158.1 acyltransferase [Hyphomicrobium sp. LHD-15]
MPKSRMVGIDIIRIIAAFLAAFFHLAYWSWAPANSTPKSVLLGAAAYPELVPYSHWGGIGVDIFFVISGFVIAYSATTGSAVDFLRRRFLRLFPGAMICASATMLVAWLIGWQPLSALINRFWRSVTFWPYGPYIDGQYWTLAIEVSFYALVLLALAANQRSRLEMIIGAMGCAIAIMWIAQWAYSGTIKSPVAGIIDARTADILLLRHGAHFALGAVIYHAAIDRWTWTRGMIAAVCATGATLAIFMSWGAAAHVSAWVWLLCVVALYLSAKHDGIVQRIFRPIAPSIAVAGLATYPFYLLHDIIGAAAIRYMVLSGVERFSALALAFVAIAALSVGVTAAEGAIRRGLSRILLFTRPSSKELETERHRRLIPQR